MIQQIYAVYDAKLGEYLAPWTSPNKPVAERNFKQAVIEEGHTFNIHAEDFSLWHLGTFDSKTGQLEAIKAVRVAHAHEIKTQLEIPYFPTTRAPVTKSSATRPSFPTLTGGE